jgi:dTDP-4-amino-4,6-dideoxygalactose transaminase
MEVPFLDLKKAYIELKSELDQLWQDINKDSFYILGSRLEKFEKEFAEYLGVKHVIGVGDGLDALNLSIRALDIGAGDQVIVPSHTYIASWLAVSEAGAIPVPVEVDEPRCLIDPSKIEQAITAKTKAIMVVHLYGLVCDMQPIKDIANKYNLKIIEDSAQAHGAFDLSSGIKAGALGDVSGFSFYPGKNLGCFGDGGCISTNDDALADKLRLLRNYGSKKKYEHEVVGINSRLDELQAGVLSIKLKCLDEWNKRRQNLARVYLEELRDIAELTLPEYNDGHVWYVFAIKTSKRDELQEFLASKGISTIIHFPKPIYLQDAYKDMGINKSAFKITEQISSKILSLPIGPHLTEEEVRFCSQTIKEFFNNDNE